MLVQKKETRDRLEADLATANCYAKICVRQTACSLLDCMFSCSAGHSFTLLRVPFIRILMNITILMCSLYNVQPLSPLILDHPQTRISAIHSRKKNAILLSLALSFAPNSTGSQISSNTLRYFIWARKRNYIELSIFTVEPL